MKSWISCPSSWLRRWALASSCASRSAISVVCAPASATSDRQSSRPGTCAAGADPTGMLDRYASCKRWARAVPGLWAGPA
eukprot:6708291-Heterocapsa_arctica.AAC.1